jgi:hypothetical protein
VTGVDCANITSLVTAVLDPSLYHAVSFSVRQAGVSVLVRSDK